MNKSQISSNIEIGIENLSIWRNYLIAFQIVIHNYEIIRFVYTEYIKLIEINETILIVDAENGQLRVSRIRFFFWIYMNW